MCIHPRCKNPVVFRLLKTKYGDQVELCEGHGFPYRKETGGVLVRLGKISEQEIRRIING